MVLYCGAIINGLYRAVQHLYPRRRNWVRFHIEFAGAGYRYVLSRKFESLFDICAKLGRLIRDKPHALTVPL
jgi:hypothetical protein